MDTGQIIVASLFATSIALQIFHLVIDYFPPGGDDGPDANYESAQ
jgi:hypothetical protein